MSGFQGRRMTESMLKALAPRARSSSEEPSTPGDCRRGEFEGRVPLVFQALLMMESMLPACEEPADLRGGSLRWEGPGTAGRLRMTDSMLPACEAFMWAAWRSERGEFAE